MATLPSLLNSRLFTPFNVPKSALNRNSPPQCSLHSHEPISVSRALETSEQLGRRAGCVLGLGAVAGTMLAFPQHANAANVVDAWSSLVSSEPQNALSLPTWVIHVASVAEWSVRDHSQFNECNVEWQAVVSGGSAFGMQRIYKWCYHIIGIFEACRVLESVFGWSGEGVQSSFRETELTNALSLPTWFIHVASVVEWVTAMALVWRYGDTPGNSTWKGLSWGMVPLLGGAMCACTWHFFYNAQSLEILVVFQAALTVLGNFTMWIAAFRIYQASQNQSKAP